MSRAIAISSSLLLAACGSSPAPSGGACEGFDAIAAASDYTSSAVGGFALDGRGAMTGGVDLGKDPILASSRGRTFLVARQEDRVFELDACGKPTTRFSTSDGPPGSGSTNPQDVAVAPDGSLFVPRYDVPSILVLSPAGAPIATIDLSGFDGDGNPNASALRIAEVGGVAKAFVTLERLDDDDRLLSKQPSWMLRIDVATRTVETHAELAGKNPFQVADDASGAWLADPGNFDAADEPTAGIERFDYATFSSRLVASEKDLGGSVAEVAIAPDGACGAAIVADASAKNRTSIVLFDPSTGAVATPPLVAPTDGFDLQGLAWASGGAVLLVGDRRDTGAGFAVHAFDRAAPCTLRAREDRVRLPQKPVALRAVR